MSTPEQPGGEGRDPWATGSHTPPVSAALDAYMAEGWAPRPRLADGPGPHAGRWAERRRAVSARFPGDALLVPAGAEKLRAGDTTHPYRPGTEAVWLCGINDPGAVLLLVPLPGGGHESRLYLHPRADLGTREAWRNARAGELWVGRRPNLDETQVALGVECRVLDRLWADLKEVPAGRLRVLRGVDVELERKLADERGDDGADRDRDGDLELRAVLHEARLVKDAWELEQVEAAVASTVRGFEDLVRALDPDGPTPERKLEGAFSARARLEGNGNGYLPIVGAGPHATILHWTANDGMAAPGQLLLVDAGVETTTLYTADVTRTLPVDGRFTPVQRRVYELVLAAQEAAMAAVRPGASFRDFAAAARRVIATGLAEWGLLPHPAETDLADDQGLHRRYTLCGIGHMLGLDVHDCAKARAETYLDGVLEVGHVLTVEPGLYFQADDLTVPEELRGTGVRIEDDVVVTETGCRLLSGGLPRRPDEIEAWMAELRRT